jgi:hypothetical protein
MPRVGPGSCASEPRSEEAGRRGQLVSVTTKTEQCARDVCVLAGDPQATQSGSAQGTHGAKLRPPLLDEAARRQHCRLLADTANAARMREKGRGLGIFHDPRGLAKYNKFPIRVRCADDERTTAESIVLTWSWSRRERGIRVLCGLVRASLLREQIAHNDVDVWLMALELAVPHGALLAGVDRVVARQQHCPEDVIRSLVVPTY